jgi:hypothetical protein
METLEEFIEREGYPKGVTQEIWEDGVRLGAKWQAAQTKNASIRLEKHEVCVDCYSLGISYNDCVCTYQKNYPTIELEFEVCGCCGNVVEDGSPADTQFNRDQLK